MFDLLSVVRDGIVVLAAMAALLYFLREQKTKTPARGAPSQDLTNMMILFQTMRDILQQQKDLARQLNESLDRKVTFIKQTVGGALDELEKLRETTRALRLQLEEAKSDLESVQKQVHFIKEAPAPPADKPETLPEAIAVEEPPAPRKPARTPAPEKPLLHVLPRPAPVSQHEDALDAWVGLDLGGAAVEETDVVETLRLAPEAPEDAEAARKAFRALLNLDAPDPALAVNDTPDSDAPRSLGGNGKTAPLHARVYEYSDAGMTVPQIARELGIGKGEVRLILGLRKDRG